MIRLLTPALAVLCCVSAAAQTSTMVARIASVTGPAMLSNGSGLPAFAVSQGYGLNPGDRLDTRAGGRVVLDLSDGSMVIVQPGTLLAIRDFRAAASVRELFEILVGAVRVKIHHLTGKPNPYRMNSPTASIAVRGTEFDVLVGPDGETKVEVLEGAVEVSSLFDPSDRTLVEAGAGVLLRPGQTLQLYGLQMARVMPANRPFGDERRPRGPDMPRPGVPDHRALAAPATGQAPPKVPGRPPAVIAAQLPDRRQSPPAQTLEEVAPLTVAGVNPIPMLYRFNAFADLHLDAIENPAYAADATAGEMRISLAPGQVFGTDTSVRSFAPQFSVVQPLAGRLIAGGSFTASRVSAGGISASAESGIGFAALRFGQTGLGVSVERLGGGTAALAVSRISATRVTAGITQQLGPTQKFGTFFRYGLLDTGDRSVEAGFRLRGSLSRNVLYGVGAGVSRFNLGPVRYDRTWFSAGLGYLLNRRTLLAFDATAGTSYDIGRFGSAHVFVHRDVTRRFFTTASFLNTWPANPSSTMSNAAFVFTQYGSRLRYFEAGPGYRFSSGLAMQYLFATDLVLRTTEHRVALRYTFRPGGE